jgi:hypothetical protein
MREFSSIVPMAKLRNPFARSVVRNASSDLSPRATPMIEWSAQLAL